MLLFTQEYKNIVYKLKEIYTKYTFRWRYDIINYFGAYCHFPRIFPISHTKIVIHWQ